MDTYFGLKSNNNNCNRLIFCTQLLVENAMLRRLCVLRDYVYRLCVPCVRIRTANFINAINSEIAIQISVKKICNRWEIREKCIPNGFYWLHGCEDYVFRQARQFSWPIQMNETEWIATQGERASNNQTNKQTNKRNPYKWVLTPVKNSFHLIGQSRKRRYKTAGPSSDTKWNGYHADWNCCS